MTDEQTNKPVNLQLVVSRHEEDEVNLYDILVLLWNARLQILLVTILMCCLALSYHWLKPAVYVSEAYLLAPKEQDIVNLKFEEFGTDSISTEDVLKQFVESFHSIKLRKQFFEKNRTAILDGSRASTEEAGVLFEQFFDKKLELAPTPEDKSVLLASFISANSELSARVLNDFIGMANDDAVALLLERLREAIEKKKYANTIEINGLREMARKKVDDRIVVVGEALSIAREAGISGDLASLREATKRVDDVSNNEDSESTIQQELYDRGERILAAELDLLKKRNNLDPFIPKLRELELELNVLNDLLKRLDVNENMNLRAIRVDQQALPPESRKIPSLPVMLLCGIISGLLLGVFIAVLRNFYDINTGTV